MLNQHVQALAKQKTWLDAQAIGMALYGLQKMAESAATEALIGALAWHVQALAKQQTWLDAQAIGHALYGLKTMVESTAVQAFIKTIIPHLHAKQKWLSTQQIAMILYSLKNRGESEATTPLLNIITLQITAMHRYARWFNAQEISNILYGLRNMRDSQAIHALLQAIALHVQAGAIFQQWLDPQGMLMALSGVQHLWGGSGASDLLTLLQPHMAQMDFTAEESRAGQWLAEAIYALRFYLEHDVPSAHNFLIAAANKLGVAMEVHTLRSAEDCLQKILQLGQYITVKRHPDTKVLQSTQLDLHLCSFELAAELCESLLTAKGQTGVPVEIIFGRASHNLDNKGKMRAIVEKSLSGHPHFSSRQISWQEGRVIISLHKN